MSAEDKDSYFIKLLTNSKKVKLFTANRHSKPIVENINLKQLYIVRKLKYLNKKTNGFVSLLEKNLIPQHNRGFYETLFYFVSCFVSFDCLIFDCVKTVTCLRWYLSFNFEVLLFMFLQV